jgi:hypothetical protein
VYDKRGLEALDYVLDSASRHGVALILSFIDQWKYANGVAQASFWGGGYVAFGAAFGWAGLPEPHGGADGRV